MCGEGHSLYEKAVIQWYKLFRKLKILFINKQNEITHSGCKTLLKDHIYAIKCSGICVMTLEHTYA